MLRSSSGARIRRRSCCSSVVPVAGLQLQTTSSVTAAKPTDVVAYTATFTNTGQVPYYGITVVDDLTDTDAWFVAFAPAPRPRVAVAVLLVGQGTGGSTAAPVAAQMVEAALGR